MLRPFVAELSKEDLEEDFSNPFPSEFSRQSDNREVKEEVLLVLLIENLVIHSSQEHKLPSKS